jgi:hypothetical protein
MIFLCAGVQELEGKLAGAALSTRLHRLLTSVAGFSADGNRVLTVSHGRVRIWDAESGNRIAELKGHTEILVKRGVQQRRQAGGDGV